MALPVALPVALPKPQPKPKREQNPKLQVIIPDGHISQPLVKHEPNPGALSVSETRVRKSKQASNSKTSKSKTSKSNNRRFLSSRCFAVMRRIGWKRATSSLSAIHRRQHRHLHNRQLPTRRRRTIPRRFNCRLSANPTFIDATANFFWFSNVSCRSLFCWPPTRPYYGIFGGPTWRRLA